MISLISKTWKFWLPLVFLLGVLSFGVHYVNVRTDMAIAAYQSELDNLVKEKVNADKKAIEEAFKGGNSTAITHAVNGLLREYINEVTQPAGNTTGSELRSSSSSARVTKESTRDTRVVIDHGLSITELEFIEKNLHLMPE